MAEQAQLTAGVGSAKGKQRFPMVSLPFVPGSAALNPDGSLVAVGGGFDGRIRIFADAASGWDCSRRGCPSHGPDDAVFNVNTAAVLFAPDGALIVGSQAGPIRFVDATTGDGATHPGFPANVGGHSGAQPDGR